MKLVVLLGGGYSDGRHIPNTLEQRGQRTENRIKRKREVNSRNKLLQVHWVLWQDHFMQTFGREREREREKEKL